MRTFQQRHTRGGKPIGENVNFERVNRAATLAANGRTVQAEDAMALVYLAQALEMHIRAVVAVLYGALEDAESGVLSADDIAYIRNLVVVPDASVFTVKGRI